jgi:hypothetical protein
MQDVYEFYRIQNDTCATNEFKFELQIQFDDCSGDTSWDIKYYNGILFRQSITDGHGSPYAPAFANQTITVYHCFSRGTSYFVDIYSSNGNGIAPPGYYRLTIDGTVVAQGGQDFQKTKKIGFSSCSAKGSTWGMLLSGK